MTTRERGKKAVNIGEREGKKSRLYPQKPVNGSKNNTQNELIQMCLCCSKSGKMCLSVMRKHFQCKVYVCVCVESDGIGLCVMKHHVNTERYHFIARW